MEIRNLTPHALSLVASDGSVVSVAPSGIVPRRATIHRHGELLGLAVAVEALGPVEGLPSPEDGVVLVVSRLVAEAVPNRADVFAPGEAVRDAAGRIVGARGLCRAVPAEIIDTFGSGPALPAEGGVQMIYGADYRVAWAGADPDGAAHVRYVLR